MATTIGELTSLLSALDEVQDRDLIQQIKMEISRKLSSDVTENNTSTEQVLTEPEPTFKGSHEIT